MKTSLIRPDVSTTLLARLINSPDLVQVIRALPAPTFSTLIRHIGLEDAGEIIALATTNQLVAVFDEDLFINPQPGEREVFDASRFIVWLDVLLEAGESVAARRIAELGRFCDQGIRHHFTHWPLSQQIVTRRTMTASESLCIRTI